MTCLENSYVSFFRNLNELFSSMTCSQISDEYFFFRNLNNYVLQLKLFLWLCLLVYTYNHSPWDTEAGGCEFGASLNYITGPCLQKQGYLLGYSFESTYQNCKD